MKNLKYILPFLVIMALFQNCEQEEILEDAPTITVEEAKAFFENQIVNIYSRTERSAILPKQIVWSETELFRLENGDVLQFQVEYEQHVYLGLGANSVLSDIAEHSTALAYKHNGEIKIEIVKRIATQDTENGFTGYVLVENWEGDLLRLFQWREGSYLGERAFEIAETEANSRQDFGSICGMAETVEFVGWVGVPGYESPKFAKSYDFICVTAFEEPSDSFSNGDDEPYQPRGGSGGGSSYTCAPGMVKNHLGRCVCEFGEDIWGNCICQYGTDQNGDCLSEEEAWEEKIDDSNLDPCMQAILDDLKSLDSDIGDIINLFNGILYPDGTSVNFGGYNWTVESGNTGNSNAITNTAWSNGVSTKFSNSAFLRSCSV